jgi:hypothetical protein
MVDMSTNVMISNLPQFLNFGCFKAQLLIEEKEAWRERHKYGQAMAPIQNFLFFVSNKDEFPFINKDSIENVVLNSDAKEDRRILSFLVHQALRIMLKQRNLFRWRNFYSKEDQVALIQGNYGSAYDVFRGIVPRIFFEKGYCMIVFEPVSRVFFRIMNPKNINFLENPIGFCMCGNCNEADKCKNARYQVSKLLKVNRFRATMVDIEGKTFDCPFSQVRIETRQKPTAGEYARILAQTAISPLDECKFVHGLVDSLSNDPFILPMGNEIAFCWLELR